MADPFADYSDVEDRWRTLSSTEQDIATTLLEDASDMIRSRWTDVDARILSGSLTVQTLTRITANMVKRAMVNLDSDGLESRSQTAGPFSVSDKFANPLGNLYLSADDVRQLDPDGYSSRSKVAWLV